MRSSNATPPHAVAAPQVMTPQDSHAAAAAVSEWLADASVRTMTLLAALRTVLHGAGISGGPVAAARDDDGVDADVVAAAAPLWQSVHEQLVGVRLLPDAAEGGDGLAGSDGGSDAAVAFDDAIAALERAGAASDVATQALVDAEGVDAAALPPRTAAEVGVAWRQLLAARAAVLGAGALVAAAAAQDGHDSSHDAWVRAAAARLRTAMLRAPIGAFGEAVLQ